MLARTKALKRNPLTKAQTRLLKHSLKRLLGNGLIEEQKSTQTNETKKLVLKNALNAIVLE